MDRSNRQLVIISLVVIAIFAALNNAVRRVALGDWWSTIALLLLALIVWVLGRPRRPEMAEETPIEPIVYERPAHAIAAPAAYSLPAEEDHKVARTIAAPAVEVKAPEPPADVLIPTPTPIAEKVTDPLPASFVEKSAELPPVPQVKAAPAQPDDLKVIEGIGPKMEKALHAAGITTFAQLAKATEAEIYAAIKAAGMRFAPSVPTWAEQAMFAEKGDWAGLEAFQKTLTAGRRYK
jgi:predicted flap endonuclease-1-like 5' DNA nuclease